MGLSLSISKDKQTIGATLLQSNPVRSSHMLQTHLTTKHCLDTLTMVNLRVEPEMVRCSEVPKLDVIAILWCGPTGLSHKFDC